MDAAKTKIVQEQLTLLGLYAGPIDGIWTPWLAGAMRRLRLGNKDAAIMALLEAAASA